MGSIFTVSFRYSGSRAIEHVVLWCGNRCGSTRRNPESGEKKREGKRREDTRRDETPGKVVGSGKECLMCSRTQTAIPSKNLMKPKISVVKPKNFNDVITLDLKIKIDGNHHILWIIDSFSRYTKGVVLKTKQPMEVIKGLLNNWFYVVGPPQVSGTSSSWTFCLFHKASLVW